MKEAPPALRRGLGEGLDPDALLGHAQRLTQRCLARGAAEAECFIEESRSLSVEIEAGRISVTGADHTLGVGVRVLVDGRVGFASASGSDEASFAAAVEAALRTARHGRQEGYHLPEATGRLQQVQGVWDPAIAALEAHEVVADARTLLARWRASAPEADMPGGGVGIDATATAIASSTGIEASDRATGASASVSLVQRGASTVTAWEARSRTSLPLELEGVVDEAAGKLHALADPRPAPFDGALDVVLSPEAVHELIGSFALGAVHGEEAMRGNTRWSGRLGEVVAHEGFSLHDDPLAPQAVGATAYDGEGLPTRRLPIIERGVLRTFLFDSWNGHRHDHASTASAVRGGYDDRPGIGTHHVTMDHTRRLDDVVADVDRGYLVDTLLGAHTANPTTGDFSVTAPNVWAIENGTVTHPCNEIALSGNVGDVLTQVRALAKQAKPMAHATLPRMLASGFQVAS